jgi:hypothetical protein
LLDDKTSSEPIIRVLVKTIENVKEDDKLVAYSLHYLNGCIEENRKRIENFVGIQKSRRADRKLDIIGVLLNFLI